MTAARRFPPRPAWSRRGLSRMAGSVALGLSLATGAAAQDSSEDSPFLQEPPTLPQSRNGIVRPQDGARLERVDRISEVFRALQACWRPPAGGYSGQEITVQFAFKRSGEILGKPKITYYKAGTAPNQREAFADAVRATFVNCTPLPFTEKLGAAIAGQLFTIRFIDAPRT